MKIENRGVRRPLLGPTKITNVTTDRQNDQNSIKRFFLAQRAKNVLAEGRTPPQELEEGQRSGPHLLAIYK